MKILTLSIRQKYFDEILKGTQTTECREVRPNNANRYVLVRFEKGKYADKEFPLNDLPEDANVEEGVTLVPIKYSALKLLTGAYKDKRPYIVVEVKSAAIIWLFDENNEPLWFEENGEAYRASEIEYTLGKVIEKSNT